MSNKSHKSFFIPILCRYSINDTVSNPTKLCDPSSPKLSCIGQIKKRSSTNTNTSIYNNNNTSGSKSSVHSDSYIKLRKFFSGRNLISPAIDTISINNSHNKRAMHRRSKSCNGTGTPPIKSKKYYMSSSDDHDIARVVVARELDPPLPVVKCCHRDQDMNVNLWKRRGFEMKSLQIQPIQVTMDRNDVNNCGELTFHRGEQYFDE